METAPVDDAVTILSWSKNCKKQTNKTYEDKDEIMPGTKYINNKYAFLYYNKWFFPGTDTFYILSWLNKDVTLT